MDLESTVSIGSNRTEMWIRKGTEIDYGCMRVVLLPCKSDKQSSGSTSENL